MQAQAPFPKLSPESPIQLTPKQLSKLILAARPKTISETFSSYTITVFFSTLLLISTFITGTGWTLAVNKQFENKPASGKYWAFSLGMTVFTILLALGFGAAAEALSKEGHINIKLQDLAMDALE